MNVAAFGSVCCLVLVFSNCSDESTTAGSSSGLATGTSVGTGGGSGGIGGAGGFANTVTGSGGKAVCVPVACEQNKIYSCADCIDNDQDGKTDAEDPDCLGPCDNNEEGYALAIPGAGNAPCKLDCYFDKDSGSGNDDCTWDSRCDPKSPQAPDCSYENPPPPSADCPASQSQSCLDYCLPLVPNGCDCFGCCDIPGGSGNFVFLGSKDGADVSTCTLEVANDPTKCKPCTPVMDCFNGCGKCELCLGKVALPPECFPGGQGGGGAGQGGSPPASCPPGIPYCGPPNNDPCPAGSYCITGCCQEVPS